MGNTRLASFQKNRVFKSTAYKSPGPAGPPSLLKRAKSYPSDPPTPTGVVAVESNIGFIKILSFI